MSPVYTRWLRALMLTLAALFAMVSCTSNSYFKPPETIPDDRQKIPKPKPVKINIGADIIDKQFSLQLEQSLDLSRQLRNITGRRKQAMNINAWDEVPDSSWFTNRNTIRQMTLEEIVRGPNSLDGPDQSGVWTIFHIKEEGVTLGFDIEDQRGDKYVIKFDPVGFSEMQSGAEIVSTKLFYAAGYNVPENYIVYFDPKILRLGENVKFVDNMGVTRLMNQKDLEEILGRVEYRSDGSLRTTASKYLTNQQENLLGPFRYEGTRNDDPNDFIPHEHRRELRGLRVMAVWLNHFDTKANNTLDYYTDEGYVKHFLMDFGSTLGSNGDEPMPPEIGYENSFDPGQVLINLFTLGFYVKPWESPKVIPYRSIGYFVPDNFHPEKYKFIIPNPAFENMTDRDAYWGAKLVMSFTDDQIRTAVAQGQYSEPGAAQYLAQVLIKRRDIIGKYWFSRINCLDKFKLRETAGGHEGQQDLCFTDMAVATGLENLDRTRYRYDLKHGTTYFHKEKTIGASLYIPLPAGVMKNSSRDDIWELKLQLRRTPDQKWSKWVKIFLRRNPDSGRFTILGISRQE